MPFPEGHTGGSGNPGAKAADYKPRKRRSEFAILAGVDPLDFLATRLGKYIDASDMPNAERIALETMPYVRPKLKSIDHKLSGNLHVAVTIGGEDDPIPTSGDSSQDDEEGGE